LFKIRKIFNNPKKKLTFKPRSHNPVPCQIGRAEDCEWLETTFPSGYPGDFCKKSRKKHLRRTFALLSPPNYELGFAEIGKFKALRETNSQVESPGLGVSTNYVINFFNQKSEAN
jgi:hypothetical protein